MPAYRHGPAARALGAVFVLAAGVGLACEDTSSSVDETLLLSLTDTVILPGLYGFADDAAALDAALEGYCASPSDAGLTDAQAAWDAARSQWKRMDVLAFGPYAAYPDRFGPNIDFYPARPSNIEEWLASDAAISAASVGEQGASLRGLTAIEYVLFSEGPDAQRRCEYLQAAAEDLVSMATGYAQAWDPAFGAFATDMVEPGGEVASPHEAVSEIVNRMGFTLENLRRDKLGKPVGEDDGTADPGAVESPFSGRSVADARDALAGVSLFFEGEDAPGAWGVVDQLTKRNRGDIVAAFRAALADADAALAAIPGPLADAVTENPDSVVAAIDALGVLQTVIQTDIANALGTTSSFNDADGD